MLHIKNLFSRLRAKKWRTLAVLILLALLGAWLIKKHLSSSSDTSFVSTDYTVQTGTVSRSLSMAGTTQFANAQKLTFVNKGRVTSVKVKIGEKVLKNQILATLTTDELDRDVEKAKKDIKNRQLDLKKVLEKSDKALDLLKAQSNYDLLVMQKQMLPSEQLLDSQTKQSEIQDTERLIKEKEKNLKEAQTDHSELLSGKAGATNAELALSENVRKRNNDMNELVNGFRSKANDLKSLLDDYDTLVKISDVYSPDDQDVYLGAKNISALNQSKNMFWQMKSYVQKLNDRYQELSKIPVGQLTENQILSGYAILKDIGAEMKAWGKINAAAFGDSIETSELTREKILSLVKTYGTSYEDKGFALINDYTNIVEKLAGLKKSDTTVEDSADKVEKLKIELEKLNIDLKKKKLEVEVAKKQQLLAGAELEKKIQDAKLDLEKAKDGNTQQEELDRIKNDIDTLQFNLTTLMKKYDEYKIIANFEGVVTKLNMQVGDSIGTNASSTEESKYIYVETPDLLEIKLEVDQLDIIKISLGMPVQVNLDTFPGEVYTGKFSEIDTMPEGGSYKAKVVFQKNNPEEKILGGMSANIKVLLEEVKDAVVAPNPAIADSEEGGKIVRLKKGENWIDQMVEIGIADDANTVITSGLKLGDVIKGLYINDTSLQNAGVVANELPGKMEQ